MRELSEAAYKEIRERIDKIRVYVSQIERGPKNKISNSLNRIELRLKKAKDNGKV